MKNSVKLIFASALLLTAASCTKGIDLQTQGESPVRFDVGVDGTKAELINSETEENSFTQNGFSVIAYEGTTKKMDKVEVTNTSGTWKTATDYYWKKNTEMKFYAFYPQTLAGTLDSKTSNTEIAPFTYSPLENGVTADVTDQTDYMLATYNGTGDNKGEASLEFSHPLASIKFIIGTFDSSVTAINSIAIGGFYTSATCAPTAGDAGFTYAWSGQSGTAEDGALSQSGLDLTPTEDAAIGTPFLLIPGQDFSSKNLTVLLTVTIDNADKTLLATINSGTLEQGKTTTCTINYSVGPGVKFTYALEPWGNTSSTVHTSSVPASNEIWYKSINNAKITPNENAFKDKNGGALTITSNTYNGYMGKIVLNGDVAQLSAQAFNAKQYLTEIILPYGVTTLGSKCFSDTRITKLVMPFSISSVPADIFQKNSSATDYDKFIVVGSTVYSFKSTDTWTVSLPNGTSITFTK